MIGTDWLRRKAPAAAKTAPLPARALHQDEADLTERQRNEAAADRADFCKERGWLDCRCAVIYSRCYYGH